MPPLLCSLLLIAPWAQAAQDATEPPRPEKRALAHAAVPHEGDPAAWPGEPLPEGGALLETPSGLRFAILQEGQGAAPTRNDTVVFHYTGWLTHGKEFQSTKGAPKPAKEQMGRLIKGWTEGLQLIQPGGRIKLVVPPELAFGEAGRPPVIPASATLVFDLELLEVKSGPVPLEVPAFVMPPADQLVASASGLQHQVLREGAGEPPRDIDNVTVHYAGWLTDGRLVASSYESGVPLAMNIKQFIAGWQEGLQLMRPGALYRFVIPAHLAYGDAGFGDSIPAGAILVYQIELLKIGR